MNYTSWKISKKLAEAGFEGESETWKHDPENFITGQKYWSYDLETILEALPKQHDFFTRGVGKYELRIWYHENQAFVGYQNFDGFDKLLTLEQQENETLADTAARLLLKLIQKKIIQI